MRKGLAGLGFLLFPFASDGRCVSDPDLLVRVEVQYCQEITVRSSRSKWGLEGPGGYETVAFHRPGEEFTALVLSGDVLESAYVSREAGASMPFEAEPFVQLGRAHLELKAGPGQQCPVHVPVEVHFLADRRCCDVIPSGGECISPFVVVREERDPGQWFKLGPYVEPPAERKSWWRKLW